METSTVIIVIIIILILLALFSNTETFAFDPTIRWASGSIAGQTINFPNTNILENNPHGHYHISQLPGHPAALHNQIPNFQRVSGEEGYCGESTASVRPILNTPQRQCQANYNASAPMITNTSGCHLGGKHIGLYGETIKPHHYGWHVKNL